MSNPQQPDMVLMLASLCDAMKRLEWAIENRDDARDYYLEEAKKRRRYVESKILPEDSGGPSDG